ncbi:MAG: SEC-C metal-binding domain-containing protein [Planctomycetota bacterium]
MDKVGRNDPCPCGSGQKYKKCCMGRRDLPQAETIAPATLVEESLDGYALTPSEQRRWLDRTDMRSHNRILEMPDEELVALPFGELDDYHKWAAAQRLRDLGDRRTFEALRREIALSETPHQAIQYVDLLEACIGEELRPRAAHEVALKAAARLVTLGPDETRRARSRALQAALWLEQGERAEADRVRSELEADPSAPLAADDFIQGLLRTGALGEAIGRLEAEAGKPDPLLADHFAADLREARARQARRQGNTESAWASLLADLEREEETRVRTPLTDDDGRRLALGRAGELQERLAALRAATEPGDASGERALRVIGHRILELYRTAEPLSAFDAARLRSPSRRTYVSIADAAIRWLVTSPRHRQHFLESTTLVFGEALTGTDLSRHEVFDLFLSWLVCDSYLSPGTTLLAAFGRTRPGGRETTSWDEVTLAMEASHVDLYRVRSVSESGAVQLEGLGDRVIRHIPLVSLPSGIGLYDGLLARLVELPAGLELGQGTGLPRAVVPALAETVEGIVAARREEHPGLSRPRALKAGGADVVSALNKLQLQWFGEGLDYPRLPPALPPRLVVAEAWYGLAEEGRTRRLLDETGWLHRDDRGRDIWRLEEHELEASAPEGRKVLAHLHLEEGRLAVECLTRGHLGRVMTLVQRVLESGAHVEGTRVLHSPAGR